MELGQYDVIINDYARAKSLFSDTHIEVAIAAWNCFDVYHCTYGSLPCPWILLKKI